MSAFRKMPAFFRQFFSKGVYMIKRFLLFVLLVLLLPACQSVTNGGGAESAQKDVIKVYRAPS
jgi:hypothetical protein